MAVIRDPWGRSIPYLLVAGDSRLEIMTQSYSLEELEAILDVASDC